MGAAVGRTNELTNERTNGGVYCVTIQCAFEFVTVADEGRCVNPDDLDVQEIYLPHWLQYRRVDCYEIVSGVDLGVCHRARRRSPLRRCMAGPSAKCR